VSEGLPARRAALAAVRAVADEDAYANLAVPAAVDALPEARDRAFASHLAYDLLRWQGTLDWLLGLVLSRPLGDVEPALRDVLRLGALQLWRTDVATHAAVSTSVDLARESVPRRRAKGAGGFVNGVLRALSRRLEAGDLPWPPDPVERLALTTAHPAWVVRDLRDRLGDERAGAVLAADNDPPGVTLRASGDREALVAALRAHGLDASPGRHAPEAVRVPGADPRRLDEVADGRATPQDEASMLVVRAARPEPGDQVLDLCAGPGGKATHLAQLVGDEGRVTAVELHEHRARLVREAAERLGLANVEVHVGDAAAPPLAPDARFDVVLLDAPCTGLGTGRRRPEVRWRRSESDVTALASIQRELLEAAAGRVATGGRLTYAVCTWTHAETDAVVDAFDAAGHGLVELERRQLLPDTDDTDGMFVVVWQRQPGPDVARR
jgi:16S rRNA (cytosine967-C5)-methyltransferase